MLSLLECFSSYTCGPGEECVEGCVEEYDEECEQQRRAKPNTHARTSKHLCCSGSGIESAEVVHASI
jgi:hypothetical protein